MQSDKEKSQENIIFRDKGSSSFLFETMSYMR